MRRVNPNMLPMTYRGVGTLHRLHDETAWNLI